MFSDTDNIHLQPMSKNIVINNIYDQEIFLPAGKQVTFEIKRPNTAIAILSMKDWVGNITFGDGRTSIAFKPPEAYGYNFGNVSNANVTFTMLENTSFHATAAIFESECTVKYIASQPKFLNYFQHHNTNDNACYWIPHGRFRDGFFIRYGPRKSYTRQVSANATHLLAVFHRDWSSHPEIGYSAKPDEEGIISTNSHKVEEDQDQDLGTNFTIINVTENDHGTIYVKEGLQFNAAPNGTTAVVIDSNLVIDEAKKVMADGKAVDTKGKYVVLYQNESLRVKGHGYASYIVSVLQADCDTTYISTGGAAEYIISPSDGEYGAIATDRPSSQTKCAVFLDTQNQMEILVQTDSNLTVFNENNGPMLLSNKDGLLEGYALSSFITMIAPPSTKYAAIFADRAGMTHRMEPMTWLVPREGDPVPNKNLTTSFSTFVSEEIVAHDVSRIYVPLKGSIVAILNEAEATIYSSKNEEIGTITKSNKVFDMKGNRGYIQIKTPTLNRPSIWASFALTSTNARCKSIVFISDRSVHYDFAGSKAHGKHTNATLEENIDACVFLARTRQHQLSLQNSDNRNPVGIFSGTSMYPVDDDAIFDGSILINVHGNEGIDDDDSVRITDMSMIYCLPGFANASIYRKEEDYVNQPFYSFVDDDFNHPNETNFWQKNFGHENVGQLIDEHGNAISIIALAFAIVILSCSVCICAFASTCRPRNDEAHLIIPGNFEQFDRSPGYYPPSFFHPNGFAPVGESVQMESRIPVGLPEVELPDIQRA